MRRGAAFVALALFSATVLSPREAAAAPALVIEASNSKILYAEDADALWHPASLTKVMTAYLVFEAIKAGKLDLKTRIACSAKAHAQPPSKLGIGVGVEITINVALNALIIKSANDVAMMLAETVAGSEEKFVELMNAKAMQLGMDRTVFVNPNGLPANEQVTTARDLGKLARAMLKDFPEYSYLWSKPEMRLGKMRISTHNGLLQSFQGADGMKTGFTCDSGFNVIATASRDQRQIIAVVLGELSSGERNIRAASLLEHGFQQAGWKQLFNQSTIDNMPLAKPGPVRSVRADVVSWGCNDKAKVANKKVKRKKPVTEATAKQNGKKAVADEAKPETVRIEAPAVGDDEGPATVELRGTTAPPPAAFGQR